jgi:RNA polymerase sigma-70 factor (ECF subfamily)
MKEFDEVYRAHVHAVFRFALRCVSNRALAEDLTADAFLELYRHRDAIDTDRLPAWLLTVVRNRARDHWRRQGMELRHLAATPLEDATGAAPLGASFDEWLLEASELKDVHRTCLVLRYVEGMTRAEIASATGLSETQVKGYLQYALELLRKAIGSARGRTA